ncbi:N-acetylmannosamine-6-phosphate 2-epimerase [Ewingella americana]|uniref:Putative N-acetylmannosamine-6-phosphate 2-epimerase n=1 Tax=Ewingella americana TaxID=41202 RepID=A0A502GK62_9GAMM|nr:N-acetylmannosamine-6-phosphate 2-epimerase [Ewingella americana]TPG62181.1 N-acetylmannosamine-6-phosphate 2-epimerase [Ewingella americana]
MNLSMLTTIKGKLVVSCQALDDEPLHSDFIMSRMALAAMQGGAVGIRANSAADVQAIRAAVPLPVIGIIKCDYPDSEVYITATLTEVDALMRVGPQMIALDATFHRRPGPLQLDALIEAIRVKYPSLLLMADIACTEEAVNAQRLGFDCIGTTLHGYTRETQGCKLWHDDFSFLRQVLALCTIPVIAEGNVDTPAMAARCLSLGAHAVVVGGAITRPQQITQRFTDAIDNLC